MHLINESMTICLIIALFAFALAFLCFLIGFNVGSEALGIISFVLFPIGVISSIVAGILAFV